jgi:hypothetical protein
MTDRVTGFSPCFGRGRDRRRRGGGYRSGGATRTGGVPKARQGALLFGVLLRCRVIEACLNLLIGEQSASQNEYAHYCCYP